MPANVVTAYIEVYPMSAGVYGRTDESRYGHAQRSRISVPYPASIAIRLPVICSQRGFTGGIWGYSSLHGVRKQLARVAAWSMAPDNNYARPILGWTVGVAVGNGFYSLPNLASGQVYVVIYTMTGSAGNVATQTVPNVRVDACKMTPLNVAF